MNDLEHDLRDLLETRAGDGDVPSTPTSKVLKRARRRQVGTVLTAIVAATAVVVASIAGIQALSTTRPEPRPGGLPEGDVADGAIVLPFATITPPAEWTVFAPADETQIVQLTNFDPEFGTPCFGTASEALPPLGVVLLVERHSTAAEASDPTWPVDLSPGGADTAACRGAQEQAFGSPTMLTATWRAGSTRFVATAAFGGAAPEEVRRLTLAAFSSLQVVGGDEPQLASLNGSPSIGLRSMNSPIGPVTLYAYRDDFEGGTSWIGIAGPPGSELGGASSIGNEIPTGDEDVTMNLGAWGGVVWGDVSDAAASAELRTVEGATFPAELVPLPSSLSAAGHVAVWGVVDGQTGSRVSTVLFDESGAPINDNFPTAPRELLASGPDPDGGTWELYLTHEDLGDGISLQSQSGGGGSCCVRSLKPDQHLRIDSWSSGSHEYQDVIGFADTSVAKVVYLHQDGTQIEGELYPFPAEIAGPMRIWVLFVPPDLPVNGDVVGFDANSVEVGREFLGDTPEPVGPTPEIDAVWQLLYRARDAWGLVTDAADQGPLPVPSAATLAAVEPRLTWNELAVATSGAVSVRDVQGADGDYTYVLVSTTAAGEAYCIGVHATADGSGGGGTDLRYGTGDVQRYDDCRGGWAPGA